MNFRYFLASPRGDVPVSGNELDRSLHVNPSEIHPALVLRDYFESIRELLLRENGKILTRVIAEGFGKNLTPERIASVDVCCEKVGTLYHVASLTVRSEGDPLKLCVATAVTDDAIRSLQEEVNHLAFLAETYHFSFLPKVFYRGEVVRQTPKGEAALSHALQEWFENHHEWHLSSDDSGIQRIILWDMEEGYEVFSIEEGAEIHRQATKILTLCYEFPTGRQIYPWSHAAGDFVVNMNERDFSVKLIAVRGYEPLPPVTGEGASDPFIRIVYFFLDLTLRMRLDRLNGTGSVLWAESSILPSVAEGFKDALSSQSVRERYPPGAKERITQMLKSFTEDETGSFLQSLLALFSGEEKSVVEKNLRDHARDLLQTMKKFF
jgi:hypothetical protein